MSLVDCSQQHSTKRKLDDYAPSSDDDGDDSSSSVRMRTDVSNTAVNSFSDQIHHHSELQPRVSGALSASCSSGSPQSHSRLQFLVRMFSGVKTLCLQADSSDTVKDIHERIQLITKIPMHEQRLIYRGKQLHSEQILADCSIENDSVLSLVGVMRSTGNPQAWQAIEEIHELIHQMCKGQSDPVTFQLIKVKLSRYFTTMPQNDNDKAAGHLKVFMVSRSPEALAMLYMLSPKNKTCGADLIRQLVTWISLLPQCLHYQCAPILIQMCKLLGMVSHDDAMYKMCRTCLGNMVGHIKFGRVSEGGGSTAHDITLRYILSFVTELAAKLSHDMIVGIKSDTMTGPLLSDVIDFKNFLHPLRTLIKEEVVVFRSRISMSPKDGKCNFPIYGEEIKCLHAMFSDLLGNMDLCLKKMEELLSAKNEFLGIGCYQYLAILVELNSISKLYQGAGEQFWTTLRDRKLSFCYLIINYARRCDDHQWIFEHKEVTNFECRRHLAMMLLPELKDEYDELHEMLIERSQLLAESFEYIAHAETDTLRAGLFLEFKNEEATGPGVLREWFFLVCQAIFDPQNALFVACPNDRRRFFPNPASKVDPLHLEYFKFAGRVIALALMHNVQIGIVFDRVLFLQLAGKTVSLEDIRDADPFLYSSCKKILEMDPVIVDEDALALTFILEVDELGSKKVVELCPDGKNIAVNSTNRRKYVDLLIRYRFVESVAEQVAHFALGFNDIINPANLRISFFQSLELEDLDGMLHGSEKAISVDDWKAHTEYYGYKETDPQISWFWKTVGGMSAEQRKVLLFFWTSLRYLPVEGFDGLASRLYIYKTNDTHSRLPSSHTCFYQLCFPPYQSLTVMQDRLHIITQEHVGCSFGTC